MVSKGTTPGASLQSLAPALLPSRQTRACVQMTLALLEAPSGFTWLGTCGCRTATLNPGTWLILAHSPACSSMAGSLIQTKSLLFNESCRGLASHPTPAAGLIHTDPGEAWVLHLGAICPQNLQTTPLVFTRPAGANTPP